MRPSLESAARSLGVKAISVPVRSDAEIEAAITELGRAPGGSLVLSPDSFIFVHRATIISLTAKYNIPAIYNQIAQVQDGALLSYGPYVDDMFRRTAPYVDRVLRGENPADLPVQVPIKFVMALNGKTAKALGLAVPASILVRADEIIE